MLSIVINSSQSLTKVIIMNLSKVIYLVLLFFVVGCSPTENQKEDDTIENNQREKLITQQTEKSSTESDRLLGNSNSVPLSDETKKLRLKKVKRDGEVIEKFKYDHNNRLIQWNKDDLFRFFYNHDSLTRVEIWEDTYDGLEQIGEVKIVYRNGKVNAHRHFTLDGKRKLETLYKIHWNASNQISEVEEYDFFDGKELVERVELKYENGKNTQRIRLGASGRVQDTTFITYDQAINPLSLTGFKLSFFNGEFIFHEKEKTSITKIKGRTVSTIWENTNDAKGILKKAVVTLPRKGKPIEFEYLYTPSE